MTQACHLKGGEGPAGLPKDAFAQAFTLIEIMVVVGIAALLIAVAVPAFVQRLAPESMRVAVSDLAEACSTARAFAILKGVPSVLRIRRAEGVLEIQMVAPPPPDMESDEGGGFPQGEGSATGGASTDGGILRTVKLNEAIHLGELRINHEVWSEPIAHILFLPNGTCDGFSLNLYSNSGERRNLWVESVTGLATVEPDTSTFDAH